MIESTIDQQRKKQRPLGLWLLVGVFVLTGMMGLVRAVLAGRNGAFYLNLGIQIEPALLVIYGIVWGITGFGGAAALFIRRLWTRKIVWAAAGLLTFSYWVDRLLLTVNPNHQINTPFVLLANAFLLLWVAWVLHRKRAYYYFQGR